MVNEKKKTELINGLKIDGRFVFDSSPAAARLNNAPGVRAFFEFLSKKQAFDAENYELIKGRFTARFTEAGGEPFEAFIELPCGGKKGDAKIVERIISDPDILASALEGELPNFLIKSFQDEMLGFLQGLLFSGYGCKRCRGRNRCRHVVWLMAVLLFKAASEPFLVFKLNGFDIIARVRARVRGEKLPPGVKAGDGRLRPSPQIPLATDLLLASALEGRNASPGRGDECPDYFDYSAIPDLSAAAAKAFPDKLKLYSGFDLRNWLVRFYTIVRDEANSCIESFKRGMARGYSREPAAVYGVEACPDYSIAGNISINGHDSRFDYHDAGPLINLVKYIPVTEFRALAPRVKALCHYFRFALRLMARSAFYPQIIAAQKKTGYYYTVRWRPAEFDGEVGRIVEAMKKSIAGGLVCYNGSPLGPAEQLNCFVSFFISVFINDALSRNTIEAANPVTKILTSPPALVSCAGVAAEAVIEFNLKDAAAVSYKIKPALTVGETGDGFEIKLSADIAAEGAAGGFATTDISELKAMPNISDSDRNAFYSLCRSLFSDCPALSGLLAEGASGRAVITPAEYFELRAGGLGRLMNFGVRIAAPDIAAPERPRPILSLIDRGGPEKGRRGAGRPKKFASGVSYLSLGELVKFDWRVAVGDKTMPLDEFEALAGNSGGVVKIAGKYYDGDIYELKKLIDRSQFKPPRDFRNIMRAALSGEIEGRPVKIEGGVAKIIERLTECGPIEIPAGLKTELREYQKRGYEWLYKNAKLSMGSVLADDMGLGKTVQAVALMLKLKEEGVIGDEKALIIVPTTLITNWVKELEKFAPSLRVHVYHGQARELKSKNIDLIITTYGVLRNDSAVFQKIKWAVICADEAQNIKNPAVAQTKALKSIDAGVRIAMTGTPIENRLMDIWSIFDFVASGYLGSRASFAANIVRPAENDGCVKTFEKFRKITAPFIMRRLKSDKNIIKDLPEKVEINEFCSLTTAQALLYRKLAGEAMAPIRSAEDRFARKGLILKLLTGLKQICNHPAQYLKTAAKADPEESGKMMTFLEILSEIIEGGEKCLVFTQFVETGKMLQRAAAKIEGARPMFLSGECSRRERDMMIEKFQNDPDSKVFILSLRAGGTGINLTAAAKVIHYDLWWNPAVEEQATGRAHRIGQTDQVMVYRMITAGTLEEKIDRMLADKKKLASDAIEAGESWLGDLSDDELAELVKLEAGKI